MRLRPALWALVAAVGCAHGQVTLTSPPESRPAAPIGVVRVVVADTLPADRLARYRALDGDRMIGEAIRGELADEGLWEEGADAAVDVIVETFRLRSASTAFWVGLYAGIDMLEGSLTIGRPGGEPHSAAFKYSGAEDNYFKFSARARLRSLARALARDVVALVDLPPD